MRTKTLHQAKLVIRVVGNKKTKKIQIVSVYDNREQKFWSSDRINKRGIAWFLNLADLKETLNWNLNGDDSKYQFKWGQSNKDTTEGVAYIFD